MSCISTKMRFPDTQERVLVHHHVRGGFPVGEECDQSLLNWRRTEGLTYNEDGALDIDAKKANLLEGE